MFSFCRLKDETRDLRGELRVLNPQIVSFIFYLTIVFTLDQGIRSVHRFCTILAIYPSNSNILLSEELGISLLF